jgi:hypothetical protein
MWQFLCTTLLNDRGKSHRVSVSDGREISLIKVVHENNP